MKKSMLSKLSIMTLAGSVLMASCTSFIEEPTQIQQVTDSEVLVSPESSTDPNARIVVEKNYFERFSNQIIPRDAEGNLIIHQETAPLYFPGIGKGNSSQMGKSYSFFNQSINEFGTIGAPVNQFFENELMNLGIVVDNSNVSSVTTDGKGNSVWFKNIQNTITSSVEERTGFVAEVEIIGGTGKFKNASGTATVNGYFNPTTGEGSTTIQGSIAY